MLNATPEDYSKVMQRVEKLLAVPDTVQYVFVDIARLYDECRFQRLNRKNFPAEVQDALTKTTLCHEHGSWLFTEWEMNVWVFIRIKNADESRRLSADGIIRDMVKNGQAVQHMSNFYSPEYGA